MTVWGYPAGRPNDAEQHSISQSFGIAVLEPSTLAPPLAQLVAHAQLSRDRRALHERYLADLRARARARVDELPMVFAQSLGPAEIARLGERIAAL